MTAFLPKVEHIGKPNRKPLNPIVALLGLAAIVAANYFAFRYFDHEYFEWYLVQGPLISLAVSVIAVAVELDQDPNLISTHPGEYAGAWVAIPGETLMSLSDVVRAAERPSLDAILTGLFGFALAALWICWLIVIGPVQYFVTLVAGAPARSAIASGRRMWIERGNDATLLRIAPLELMPEGAQEVGLARRPVSVTSTIIAGVLFAGSQFV